MSKQSFTFHMPPHIHARMKAYKAQTGASMSDLCRRAVEAYLDRHNIHPERDAKTTERRPVRLPDVSDSPPIGNDTPAELEHEKNSRQSGRAGVENTDEGDSKENDEGFWWE